MKRLAIVAGCVLAGLAVGGLWTLLQGDRYRADARVLVRPASVRIVPAVQALAESSLVATNVAQTLHLSSPPKISTTRGDSGVLTISTGAGSRDRARQVDAEAVVILMQKVAQRFAPVHASATVLDPAHVAEQTSPTPGRNLLIAGLAGLVIGGLVAALISGRSPARAAGPAAAVDPRVERRLQARIDQVTRRERALAQRAGQLAAREQDLERREAELETVSEPPPAPEPEPQPAPAPEPEPEPEPPAEPEPEPEPPSPPPSPAPVAAGGGWTLQALEELTRERSTTASAERQEEWSTYLFLLREHAGADGTLPSSFDQLVNDVFGPLPHPPE